MGQTPTTHASETSTALGRKLAQLRTEEAGCGARLDAIETDIAHFRAQLDAGAAAPQSLMSRRLADFVELRAALIAERARRRREIDEIMQRKEAIDAALVVLRDEGAARVASRP